MKWCPRCETVKAFADFCTNNQSDDGLNAICRLCDTAGAARRQSNNLSGHAKACARWREKNRNYRTEREKVDLQFKLRNRLRGRIFKALQEVDASRKATMNSLIGCSGAELEAWLYSPTVEIPLVSPHIDHIIPLGVFDLQTLEAQEVACNFRNLRILSQEQNLKRPKNGEDLTPVDGAETVLRSIKAEFQPIFSRESFFPLQS
jgi:hypothetical protein